MAHGAEAWPTLIARGAEVWPALTAHGAEAWPALAGLVMTAATYARGWWRLSRRTPGRFGAGRLGAFLGGLAVIAVALASPLDELAEQSLSAHMVQHQLLMMLAPPLLWLGAPSAPMLLGLPRRIRRPVAVALASRLARRVAHLVAHPAFGWLSFTLAFWTWHAPPLYELALRSHAWHHLEHTCFFASALLFWRPVILPWPGRSPWPRWMMIPYLILADLQNTVLAAILTFSDRVIYPANAIVRAGRLSALEDQATAGVIMWVPGSLVFLVAAVWLAIETLDGVRAVRGIAAAGASITAVGRAGRARSSWIVRFLRKFPSSTNGARCVRIGRTVIQIPKGARNMRRLMMAVLVVGSAVAVLAGLAAAAQSRTGTLKLTDGSVAAGIGYSWGKGTLTYGGKTYPVKVDGLSVGEVGVTRASALGTVKNLEKVADFSGTYVAVGAGATVAGGADVTVMRNQNGVVVEMTSTTQGASLKLGADGIRMTLAH